MKLFADQAISGLKAALDQSIADHKEIREYHDHLANLNAKLSDRIKATNARINKATDKQAKAKSNLDSAQAALEVAKTNATKTAETKETARSAADKAEADMTQHPNDLTLKKIAEDAETAAKLAESQDAIAEGKKSSAQKSVDDATAALNDANQQLDEAKADLEELEALAEARKKSN
jgi:chromosome segregation ATPase